MSEEKEEIEELDRMFSAEVSPLAAQFQLHII